MALLKCEAWQAVVVRQTGRSSALIHQDGDDEEEGDSWKRPKTEEEHDD